MTIAPGTHVAIVGPSGAGKSTLVGLFLGWHRPATGQILVDGSPLTEARLHDVRRMTAWVDPAVQIWNRTLAANLRYGLAETDDLSLEPALELAGLDSLLPTLENGLATNLGESGGLLSGGEGQRVRLGRALLRPQALDVCW